MVSFYDYTPEHQRMEHMILGNKHYIKIDFENVKNLLIETEVHDNDEIEIMIMYPI